MTKFLFDVDAWLSSTAIAGMTAAEERGYLRLLLHAWKQPDCGLPDEDDTLASLSLLGPGWRRSAAKLRACFEKRGGRLYNARLLQEWEYQRDYHSRQREAAGKRWNGRSGNAAGMPRDIPRHMPRHSRGTSRGNPKANTAYAVEEENIAAAASVGEENGMAAAGESPPPLDEDRVATVLCDAMRRGTPPPDAALVGRVVDAMHGATVEELAVEVQEFGRRRRPPDSYGFWPIYVAGRLGPGARRSGGKAAASVVSATAPPVCATCDSQELVTLAAGGVGRCPACAGGTGQSIAAPGEYPELEAGLRRWPRSCA